MYKVILVRNCRKQLEGLRAREHDRIIGAITELEQEPRPRGVEKLRGSDFWRIREGDYRIIYAIDDKEKVITITKIGHSREIYRGY